MLFSLFLSFSCFSFEAMFESFFVEPMFFGLDSLRGLSLGVSTPSVGTQCVGTCLVNLFADGARILVLSFGCRKGVGIFPTLQALQAILGQLLFTPSMFLQNSK